MAYPTQLNLEPETEQALIQYLDNELVNHLAERGVWIQDINDYQRDYIAKPSEEKPSFPFQGAANLIIPLTAIAVEAVESRTIQKLFALKQKTSVTVKDPSVENIQDELERYLDDEIVVYGEAIENLIPAVQEVILLGTGVAKATYKKVTKRGMMNGKSFEVEVQNGTYIESVPVTNFIMPFDCLDPQTARWCGEVFWTTPLEVPQMERDGFFAEGTTEKLRSYYTYQTPGDDALLTTQREEQLENREPIYPQRIQFYLVYTQFVVTGLTEDQRSFALSQNIPCDEAENFREIYAIYHKDSRQLVSVCYNPYEDLRRPYRYANYFPKAYRWSGIGIAEQNKAFQEEVTVQHRQIIDSGTIANTRMWKVRKGNNSIRDDEPIFPNKIWWVDDMDDVQAFKNDEIFASSFNMENQAVIYSQQRTGVNEITLGMPGVGTPGTATDSSLRVQESQRKGDYTYGNTKRWISQLLWDSTLNIIQYGPNVDRLRYSPKGSEIEMFLKRPFEDFRKKLLLTVQLVDQNDNAMLDRQTMTQLSGTAQQYYNALIPILTQLAAPTPVSPLVYDGFVSAIRGANEIFTKILETYGIRDPQKYLIKVPPPQQQAQPMPTPNEQNPFAGINGSPNAGTPLALPSSTVNNVNIGDPNLLGQIPQGLAGLLS